MKKLILLTTLSILAFTACKNEPKESEVIQPEMEETVAVNPDSDKKDSTYDYLFKADNGEILEVDFFDENDSKYVKVKREGQDEIILKQEAYGSQGRVYEKDDFRWVINGGQNMFSEGSGVMKLVQISPLDYTFTNGEEDISVSYFDKDNERFVSIGKENQEVITLPQTEAWAKGAEYTNDSMQWRSQGNEGTLTLNGEKSEYKEKK